MWAGRRVTCGVEATLPLRLVVLSSSSGTAAATPPDGAGRGGSGSTAAAVTAVGLSNGGRSTAVATPSRGGTAEWSDSICVDEDETSDGRLCFELHEFGADAQNSSSSAVSLASASGTLSSTMLHQGCMALASIVGPGGYQVALSAVGDKIGSEAAAAFETCDIHATSSILFPSPCNTLIYSHNTLTCMCSLVQSHSRTLCSLSMCQNESLPHRLHQARPHHRPHHRCRRPALQCCHLTYHRHSHRSPGWSSGSTSASPQRRPATTSRRLGCSFTSGTVRKSARARAPLCSARAYARTLSFIRLLVCYSYVTLACAFA